MTLTKAIDATRKHWDMVRGDLKIAVWNAYKDRMTEKNRDWLKAARAAIDAVARKEGR